MCNSLEIIKVIIIVELFFTAYLLYFRNRVYKIMIKEGVNIFEKVDSINDYKSIYLLLISDNNKLSNQEKFILWLHIFITLTAIILWVVLLFITFFTNW